MTDRRLYKMVMSDSDPMAMRSFKSDLATMEDRDLRSGVSIKNYWDSNAKFMVHYDHEEDYLALYTIEPVISDRLKSLMVSMNCSGVEYYPINVQHVDNRLIGHYWYAHVLGLEGTLDIERSVYRTVRIPPHPQEGMILIKPVLRYDVAAARDLFRMSEYSSGIYVSSRLRDQCIKNRFTGMVFREQTIS